MSTARERARIRDLQVGSLAYTECRSIWVRGWRIYGEVHTTALILVGFRLTFNVILTHTAG